MKRKPFETVKHQLRTLQVKPQKERGQNFLVDGSVLDKIVDFARPRTDEVLVEIGPGLGALTKELARFQLRAVIEIEHEFCERLRTEYPAVEVIESDARYVDFSAIGERITIFSNVPYSFSTDLVFHLVDNSQTIERAILLLQKEFADRLAAEPGGKTYGTTSIACQLMAEVRLGPIVGGDSFHPKANVDSRIVELRFRATPKFEVKNSFWFKQTVKAAFFKRRKKILNSMNASSVFPELHLADVFAELGMDPERRPETLSVAEYASLANALTELLEAAQAEEGE
ncbi:MAG: ribosomal RNA small subunit methyltransferase A [Bdellovibrionales bacterium]|nr:ribosomal RNA small subunit methyltransferase A [Bdellovibrionales bacterium]